MKIKNCCYANKKTKKCLREDGKTFLFPRRFTKEQCLENPIRGYSMTSSCAPFKNCRKNNKKTLKQTHKSNKKILKGGGDKNILGTPLQKCSTKPLTGYTREGTCEYVFGDSGRHLVCAKMTKEFLDYTKSQGNDLSSVVKTGQKWCLCESRWLDAYREGKSPPVDIKSTSNKIKEEIKKVLYKKNNIIRKKDKKKDKKKKCLVI